METRKKLRNRPARIAAVQAMYQKRITEKPANEIIFDFCSMYFLREEKLYNGINVDFFKKIVTQFDVDRNFELFIKEKGMEKELSSASLIAGCIIEVATIEMSIEKIDYQIVISEYVNVAKGFINEKDVKFVNAVLDRLFKINE